MAQSTTSPVTPGNTSATLRAVLWMAGTLLSFCAMAIAVRELLASYGAFQILFLRALVGLVMVLVVLPRFGLQAIRTRRLRIHVVRNVLHFGGQLAWVYALSVLTLATVFAIEFTMPVWTAVLAALLLGERMNRGRAMMLASGIAGILIILRPGLEVVQPGALVMLLGSLAYATTMITTKQLSGSDTPLALLFYMSLIQIPLALVPALPRWVTPALADAPWILCLGIAGFTAHYCMARAFRLADATVVVPLDFLRLPLIAVVGMLFYAEPLQPAVLLGAAVMCCGIYYSVRHESGRRVA
jgi:drug/metabolite transporter (DMT)-like permease